MEKGYLCDGCGDREPTVYCSECKLYFCDECDAYLHPPKDSACANAYSEHARQRLSASSSSSSNDTGAQARSDLLTQKREVDAAIQRVSAAYAELSAQSVEQSRAFLEQSVGAHLASLRAAQAASEGVLRAARARRSFLEAQRDAARAAQAASDDRAALLALARLHTTAALEQRLRAAAADVGALAARYSQAQFSAADVCCGPAARALGALLDGGCDGEALVHDERFFPGTFRVTLDFGVTHTLDAAAAEAAPRRRATLAWKAPDVARAMEGAQMALVELRVAGGAAPYKACYSGDAETCALEGLEEGVCYEARVTALSAPGKRLPYVSAPHKITVPKCCESKEKKDKDEKISEAKKFCASSKKIFYQGCWEGPTKPSSPFTLSEDWCVIRRNDNSPGDYAVGVCNEPLGTAPGTATAWTFGVEEAEPESHLYLGIFPKAAAGADAGHFFCATCGALRMAGGEHVDVPDCPKGSVKAGTRVGFEFLVAAGGRGTLVISVNGKALEKRICDIPLDAPLFPAVACKSGKIRIIS